MKPECYTTPEEFIKNADREFTVRDLVDCTKIKPSAAAGMLSSLVTKGKLNVKRVGFMNVYSKAEFPRSKISARRFLSTVPGTFTTNDFAQATGIVDSLGTLKHFAKKGIVTWYKSGNRNYWTVIADVNELEKQKPGRKPNTMTERKRLAQKFFNEHSNQTFTAREFADALNMPITSTHPYLNKYIAKGILEMRKLDGQNQYRVKHLTQGVTEAQT